MIELKIKNNSSNRTVYINGKPQIQNIPNDVLDILALCLEKPVYELFNQRKKP